ncbi:MAG: ABC transporter permease [Anaerolineae bacterium]|jgi:putative aldouronate transport system permease protein
MVAEPSAKRRPGNGRSSRFARYMSDNWPLYVMFLPGFAVIALFRVYPAYGRVIAFQNFNPALGFARSPWVGLENFEYALQLPNLGRLVRNTLVIAISKMVALQVAGVFLALLLNEVRVILYKRAVQSLIYLPYFLSWVVLAGILRDVLPPQGLLDQFLGLFGLRVPLLLGDNSWFRLTLVGSHVWREVGFSMILYLAALTAIDPGLYEAAAIDGANRFQRILHITLPGMSTTVILIACLNLGGILSAGFEQILTLYNPVVYETGDVLETYIYRAGLISARYSLAGAIELVNSVIGFVMVVLSRHWANKWTGYQII